MRTLHHVGGDPDVIAFPQDEVTPPTFQHFQAAVLDMEECRLEMRASAQSGNMCEFLSSCMEMQMRAPALMLRVTQSYFLGLAGLMGMTAERLTPQLEN